MTVTVEWNSEQCRFLVMTFAQNWQPADLAAAIERGNALADQTHHNPALLVDLSQTSIIPKKLVSHLRRLPASTVSQQRDIVIAGVNNFSTVFIQNILFVLFPQVLERITFYTDVNDAYAHLAKQAFATA